ncbi:hypothetical protein [Heliorestis acidaminivorans]|uniref:hypothetical protein n=1 Tax=Heliorestis acidaminivorans TaxID=553427 RepID=UPI001479724C|nr:hypothetical protein [Heliorestis acidaminivorans]
MFFNKLDRPVILKEESDVTDYISKLQALRSETNGAVKAKIDQEIKLASRRKN